MKKKPIDILVEPVNKFINNSIASGIVLFIAAILALVLSNSSLSHAFHQLWEHHLSFSFDKYVLDYNLHHWINDGLMSIFFFVVGLELKRELIAGELAKPKQALLPILGALGGMMVPGIIYWTINSSSVTESSNGWGIPMATDIAFALGVIYLLGDRVPNSIKVFLAALAIIDDLGAVLVIAFFYTSDISLINLVVGGSILCIMYIGNRIGIRSAIFYGILGTFGVWLAFLTSGVHATIAAVLCAFTIPVDVKITEKDYLQRMQELLKDFDNCTPSSVTTITEDQQNILAKITSYTNAATTPLQKLVHSLHPTVAFIIMPIFALANAGVTFSGDLSTSLHSPVTLGVFLGLLVGKVVGVFGTVFIFTKLKIVDMPTNSTHIQILGVSFLAGIGFTMSLFVTTLAFTETHYQTESKIGIFSASLIAGIIGYTILRLTSKKNKTIN
jgi:NhaA family Na+:H+ antiporter